MKNFKKLKWILGIFGLLVPIPLLVTFNKLPGFFGNAISLFHSAVSMIAFLSTGISRMIYGLFGASWSSSSSSVVEKISFMISNGFVYFIFGYILINILEKETKISRAMASLFVFLFLFLNGCVFVFMMIFLSA